jgi:ParB family chromosome partitioning protein
MNDAGSTVLVRPRTGKETKAKTKKASRTLQVSSNSNRPEAVQPDYKLIPRKDLQPSATNPRRRIDEQSIDSLAGSIRTQGILEPLIVRENGKKYEIVCGERRYRAAGAIKDERGKPTPLEIIPCLVRELTDEQVLDIQIHENLHREDIHPMDEAYGYQFLKEKLGCDVKELALRVGKSEGYVLNRLKLNLLIKEAQKDIDDGFLPLVYALEIAKYTPEIQKLIYEEVYKKEGRYKRDHYVYIPIKGETVSWKSFIEWINTNIHRLLSKAPFDLKAINLRPDGLACINCPERTGAAVSLFEPNQIRKKDACLNRACYLQKAKNHVEVRRQELAEIAKVKPAEVPIVRSWSYASGKDYLGTEAATVISGAKHVGNSKSCDLAVSAIDIEADNYGQTVQICLKTSKCKIHWPESKASSNGNAPKKSSEEEAAERLDARCARREEMWNAKVAEAVRIRVFRQAAESFEKNFGVAGVGTDFLPQLIARFWRMSVLGDSSNLNKVVKHLMAVWVGKSGKPEAISVPDGQAGVEYFKKLRRGVQFRILFLLIHGYKGAIANGNNYRSQREVRELAKQFKVDYALIDAEVRLELSAKKYRQEHEIHLEGVRKKNRKAKIPCLYSKKWKAAD